MILIKRISFVCLLLVLPFFLMAQEYPNTFVIRHDNLIKNKAEFDKKNPRIVKAVHFLMNDANQVLKKNLYSITEKKVVPEGGTINDYYSLAPYWWPDPKKKDGLPFIRIDGKVNPLIHTIPDHDLLAEVGRDAVTLGLAYFFTNEEKYAKKLESLIKYFFMNPATKMNPNLNFSGVRKGRGKTSNGNIVDGNALYKLVDGIQLIQDSKYWTSSDQKQMEEWFNSFLSWMLHSQTGKHEANRMNNMGVYYTLQAATYYLFVNKEDSARLIINNRYPKLINKQFGKNGEMPMELNRATPYNYIKYNLRALAMLANVAQCVDIDLWNYKNNMGVNMKDAFEWLLPYAKGKLVLEGKNGKRISMQSIKQFLYYYPVKTYSFIQRLFLNPKSQPSVTIKNYRKILENY